MFPTNSIAKEGSGTYIDESNVCLDSFTGLIQRAVERSIRRLRQKNRQALVLKKARSFFSQEIRCMMHIYGDVENPLPDSIKLVEKILRNQMNMLLEKAARVSFAPGRKSHEISHKELVYLLRKKEDKLRRLLQYLSVRDARDLITRKTYHHLSGVINGGGKRVKMCLDFLKKLKESEDYKDILHKPFTDPLITQRLKMRYFHTLDMDNNQYLEYSKKLQSSFYPSGRGEKFKKWIMADNPSNLVLTEFALEIMNYLARETVAEIVESSIKIQKNVYSCDFYQRLNTGGFRISHASEICYPEHGDNSNSTALTGLSSKSMGSTSTDSVNNCINQSAERSESSVINDSNLKLDIATNRTCSNLEKDKSSVGHSRWQGQVSSFYVEDPKSVPLQPRSIREFMHRSAIPLNYLNAQVSRKKLKRHVLCL